MNHNQNAGELLGKCTPHGHNLDVCHLSVCSKCGGTNIIPAHSHPVHNAGEVELMEVVPVEKELPAYDAVVPGICGINATSFGPLKRLRPYVEGEKDTWHFSGGTVQSAYVRQWLRPIAADVLSKPVDAGEVEERMLEAIQSRIEWGSDAVSINDEAAAKACTQICHNHNAALRAEVGAGMKKLHTLINNIKGNVLSYGWGEGSSYQRLTVKQIEEAASVIADLSRFSPAPDGLKKDGE